MLGDHPMDVLLLATDLQASRDFYALKIGLEIVQEKEDAVWFKCGGGSRLASGMPRSHYKDVVFGKHSLF